MDSRVVTVQTMNSPRLVQGGWHDEYEFLLYFTIVDLQGKQLWMSSWWDVRDLDDRHIASLKDEISDACHKFGAAANLSTNDYWNWEYTDNKEQ